jgi:hypothetical protein
VGLNTRQHAMQAEHPQRDADLDRLPDFFLGWQR